MSIPDHVGKYIPGDNLLICDRTGRVIRRSEARVQWNGLVVHESEWEARHPQDFVRAVKEDIAAPEPRRPNNRAGLCDLLFEASVFDPLVFLECYP